MAFRPETAKPLNELVDVLLRGPHTLTPGERELIATFVSAQNDCRYCQTIHGAIAAHHLGGDEDLVSSVKRDSAARRGISDKLKALLVIAGKTAESGKQVTAADVERARQLGATDLEIHDTVLIAAVFCMCNRYVDGLATWAPDDPDFYRQRAALVAEHGYAASGHCSPGHHLDDDTTGRWRCLLWRAAPPRPRVGTGSHRHHRRRRHRPVDARSSPAPGSRRETSTPASRREATAGARRLLPAAAAAGRPVLADRRSAAVRDAGPRGRSRSTSARRVASNVQLELSGLSRDASPSPAERRWSTRRPTRSARVVTGRELVDLPLNGRNFTQLGLLQTGVAPLTAGVTTAGGSLRQGQAYAVNGMRPEQNVYLVDGAQNSNRMDGGYALRHPGRRDRGVPDPDAERAARIRRHRRRHHQRRHALGRQPAARQRSTSSSATTPSTRATSSPRRSSRSKQNQFGGTRAAARSARDRVFVLRLLRGLPQPAGHHDQRHRADGGRAAGRLLGHGHAAAQPRGRRRADSRATRFPSAAINPVARNVLALYPLGNVSPSIYRETLVGTQRLQPGRRAHRRQRRRRTTSSSPAIRSPAGTTSTRSRCAAPTRRASRRATTSRRTRRPVAATRILSPSMTNSLRATYLRHQFFFDQRQNRTPPGALGFGYSSSNDDRARGRRSSTSAATRRSAARSPARATPRSDVRAAGQRWRGRAARTCSRWAVSTATPASTCSRPSRRTRSTCSPARSRPTTPSPTCCSARR